MIDRWHQQQQIMNLNSSSSLCFDPNNSNSSSSYSSTTSSSNTKSNNNKMNESGPPPPAPAPAPVERKNSIGLMDALLAPIPIPPQQQTPITSTTTNVPNPTTTTTVDDAWNNILSARTTVTCKQEEEPDTMMMTLEDFLAKAGAVDQPQLQLDDVKPHERLLSGGRMLSFDNPIEDDVNSRGKRRPALDPLQDKAAQQRQRRMIKNRESAARSRERKQAYQAELESIAFKLEEENNTLIKAKEEQTRTRYKQLMDNIIPVTEKRRPTRYMLKKVRSMEW